MRVLVIAGLIACASKNDPASLVATRPAGTACAGAGIEIDTGFDANHDSILEPDEITSTSVVCEPPAPPHELVGVVAEQPGPNCPNGGQAIETGEDTNGNGVLDPVEVTATSYVCTGGNGVETLVRVDPAGAGCAHGGSAIHSGLDTNDNGVLDDSEIASTSYVCDGASGQVILVRVDPEPAGDNCADGGTAIQVGIDANADGALEDGEIESTSYLCGAPPLPSVIDGDFTVENDIDLARLTGVTEITGSLIIADDEITDLTLPNLRRVGGALRCKLSTGPSCPNLATVDLPALTTVSDHPVSDPNLGIIFYVELTSIHLPALITTPSIKISIVGSIDLPALTTGYLVTSYTHLTSVSLPVLAHGGIQIDTDFTLAALDLPALVDGGISIEHAPLLSTISAPVLVTASVELNDMQNLAALAVPRLTSGSYVDVEHTALDSLPFPSLSTLTYLNVSNNPAIPTCAAQALAAQTHATTVTISGDDDIAVCP